MIEIFKARKKLLHNILVFFSSHNECLPKCLRVDFFRLIYTLNNQFIFP